MNAAETAIELDGRAQQLRLPPHSIESEQAVVGGLLLDNSAWERIGDAVTAEDFYRREHRVLFAAISRLAERDDPFDVITVTESLRDTGQLAEAGGSDYLAQLAIDTASAANIEAYARLVREHAIRRELLAAANAIAASVYATPRQAPPALLDAAEGKVFQIADSRQPDGAGFRAISPLLGLCVDRLEVLRTRGDSITGIPTGFHDLDERTSGLQPGDLVIIAGRPSMGKTSFSMNIAENVAIKVGKPVAIFSMEMPAEQLAMRMLASLGRIDQQKLRTGRLDQADWPRVISAVSLLDNQPMFIDDSAALSPVELRARARRLKREHGDLGLVVIDYLQLMQSPSHADNRVAEISEISRSLKALAKELSVPVIALSQLNRNLESRPNKRPVMSDLRDSGSIEQDADVIFFIYRDEVYNENSQDKGVAEIVIGKQRNGPIGTVKMTFISHLTRFEDYVPYREGYGDVD